MVVSHEPSGQIRDHLVALSHVELREKTRGFKYSKGVWFDQLKTMLSLTMTSLIQLERYCGKLFAIFFPLHLCEK